MASLEDVRRQLCKAVELDVQKKFSECIPLYKKSVGALLDLAKDTTSPERRDHYTERISKYYNRIAQLERLMSSAVRVHSLSSSLTPRHSSSQFGKPAVPGMRHLTKTGDQPEVNNAPQSDQACYVVTLGTTTYQVGNSYTVYCFGERSGIKHKRSSYKPFVRLKRMATQSQGSGVWFCPARMVYYGTQVDLQAIRKTRKGCIFALIKTLPPLTDGFKEPGVGENLTSGIDHEAQQGFIPLSYLHPWFDSFNYRTKLELTNVGDTVSPSADAAMTCATQVLSLDGTRYCSKRYYVVARNSSSLTFISKTSLRVYASDAKDKHSFFQPDLSLRNGRRVYVHFFRRSSDRVWYAWGVALRTRKQQEKSKTGPYWHRKIKLVAGFIRVEYLKDIPADKSNVNSSSKRTPGENQMLDVPANAALAQLEQPNSLTNSASKMQTDLAKTETDEDEEGEEGEDVTHMTAESLNATERGFLICIRVMRAIYKLKKRVKKFSVAAQLFPKLYLVNLRLTSGEHKGKIVFPGETHLGSTVESEEFCFLEHIDTIKKAVTKAIPSVAPVNTSIQRYNTFLKDWKKEEGQIAVRNLFARSDDQTPHRYQTAMNPSGNIMQALFKSKTALTPKMATEMLYKAMKEATEEHNIKLLDDAVRLASKSLPASDPVLRLARRHKCNLYERRQFQYAETFIKTILSQLKTACSELVLNKIIHKTPRSTGDPWMPIKKEVLPLLGELEMLWVQLSVTAKMLKIVNGVILYSFLTVGNVNIEKRLITLGRVRSSLKAWNQQQSPQTFLRCRKTINSQFLEESNSDDRDTRKDIGKVKQCIRESPLVEAELEKSKKWIEKSIQEVYMKDFCERCHESVNHISKMLKWAKSAWDADNKRRSSGELFPRSRGKSLNLTGMYALEKNNPFHVHSGVMKVHLEVWKKNYKNDMSFPAYVALQPHLTQDNFDEFVVDNAGILDQDSLAKMRKQLFNQKASTVKYLQSPAEREPYRVYFSKGQLTDCTGNPFDTSGMHSNSAGHAFAICAWKKGFGLYAGSHEIRKFHHSSFFAGEKVNFAGEIKAENGILKVLTSKSGHYKPTDAQLGTMLKQFSAEGFDLASLECWTFDAAMAALGEEHKYNKEPADVALARIERDQQVAKASESGTSKIFSKDGKPAPELPPRIDKQGKAQEGGSTSNSVAKVDASSSDIAVASAPHIPPLANNTVGADHLPSEE